MTDVEYDDGLFAFLVLALAWGIFSFEAAVIVGMAWIIAGISRSNAIMAASNS